MANRQLVDYIISLKSTAFSKDQVKAVLLEIGWQEHDIEEAFQEAADVHSIRLDKTPLNWARIAAALLLIISVPLLFSLNLSTPTGHAIAADAGDVESTPLALPLPPALPAVPRATETITVLESIEKPAVTLPAQEENTNVAAPAIPTPLAPTESPEVPCESRLDNTRDPCFTARALETNDERTCNLVRESNSRTECILNIAITTHNHSLCKTVGNIDACYETYTRATHDTSACERIVFPSSRDACLALG